MLFVEGILIFQTVTNTNEGNTNSYIILSTYNRNSS